MATIKPRGDFEWRMALAEKGTGRCLRVKLSGRRAACIFMLIAAGQIVNLFCKERRKKEKRNRQEVPSALLAESSANDPPPVGQVVAVVVVGEEIRVDRGAHQHRVTRTQTHTHSWRISIRCFYR